MQSIISVYNFKNVLNPFKLLFCIFYWKVFGQREFKFDFLYKGNKFSIYSDSYMDFVSLRETFLELEYDFKYVENPKVILDLGANVGDTSIYFSYSFPQAKVFAVEPNEKVFQKLVKNTKQFPNIICCNCAVGNETKKVEFSFSASHFGGSIIKREQNIETSLVDMYSLTDFVSRNSIGQVDILKFDIEGAEKFLLEDKYILTGVKNIVGEIHLDLAGKEVESQIKNLNLKETDTKQLSKDRYIIFGKLV